MFVCLSVCPIAWNRQYPKNVRVLVFVIKCILHDRLKSYSNFNDNKCVFTSVIFLNILVLPLTKVESQIYWLQKDSWGKSNERTLVIGQNLLFWLRNGRKWPQEETNRWWVLVKISSNILMCILGELAGGESVAVAVYKNNLQMVTEEEKSFPESQKKKIKV